MGDFPISILKEGLGTTEEGKDSLWLQKMAHRHVTASGLPRCLLLVKLEASCPVLLTLACGSTGVSSCHTHCVFIDSRCLVAWGDPKWPSPPDVQLCCRGLRPTHFLGAWIKSLNPSIPLLSLWLRPHQGTPRFCSPGPPPTPRCCYFSFRGTLVAAEGGHSSPDSSQKLSPQHSTVGDICPPVLRVGPGPDA